MPSHASVSFPRLRALAGLGSTDRCANGQRYIHSKKERFTLILGAMTAL